MHGETWNTPAVALSLTHETVASRFLKRLAGALEGHGREGDVSFRRYGLLHFEGVARGPDASGGDRNRQRASCGFG